MSLTPGYRTRVGLELTCLELNRGGTSRAARNLWAALEELETLDVQPLRHTAPRIGSGRFARGLARELIYFPVGLSYLAGAKDLDVLHCPSHLVPSRSSCPLVVTLNDIRAWRQPATLSRGNALQHMLVVRRALRRAAAIITPSQFSRNEVLDFFDLDPARVVVTPYGIPKGFRADRQRSELPERLGIAGPYVLAVGTAPHKNLAATVSAFEHVVRMGAPHDLVIAGPPEDDPGLPALLAKSPAASRIHQIGYVEDETLIDLYRGAGCLLHPSRYEGFGFPPLEAMACGVPVIAARATATEEIVGNGGVLVDPDDFEGFGHALEHLLGSFGARIEYAGRGIARTLAYSWQRCAELTASVYEQVAQEGASDLGQAA